METVVRVQGREARLTGNGWKTGDSSLDQLCRDVMSSGLGGFHYDPNPEKACALKLAAALDGEIISVAELDESEEIPADAVC
jgi:hypothetical protein